MEDVKDIGVIDAPYGKQLIFKDVTYDNGFKLMRLRIKEGKRFTDLDLDVNTIKQWQKMFNDWVAAHPDTDG